MDLSVVVPTLNSRDRLAAGLDALADHAPEAELIVVNGPSTDGTTGMVRARDDVDVLVEVPTRTLNVARNAGIAAARGDAIALVGQACTVEPPWREAVERGLSGAAAVTGPVRRRLRVGATADEPERRTIDGREVTYFDGGNVAFRRGAVETLDGFDEYLETGGARDAAHRLAGRGLEVQWTDEMAVRRDDDGDGSRDAGDWAWKYRALSYRLVKNYGPRLTVARRTVAHAVQDAVTGARDVLGGTGQPTGWLGRRWVVAGGVVRGAGAGLVARVRDRSPARNPNGLSRRADRAVVCYDRRGGRVEREEATDERR